MSTLFYRFAKRVMQIVMPLCYRIRREGTENLPQEGGYLFISNHRSMADAILIPLLCPKQQFFILAKQEKGFVLKTGIQRGLIYTISGKRGKDFDENVMRFNTEKKHSTK